MWPFIFACQQSDPTGSAPPLPVDSATSIPSETADTSVPLVPMLDEALAARCPSPNNGDPLHPGSSLKRVTLSGAGRCNDGSSPVLYIRAATDPERAADWVWFFDGGSFCGTNEACAVRWCGANPPFGRRHMSSRPLPAAIGADGIMSFDEANTFAGWNMVFAAYCTSDLWTGTRSDVVLDGVVPYRLHFEGALVAEDGIAAGVAGLVSDDGTVSLPSLADAARILAAGTSAGGNAAVYRTPSLQRAAPAAQVTTVVDASFHPAAEVLSPEHRAAWEDQMIRFSAEIGDLVWGTTADSTCAAAHPGEEWRCTHGDEFLRDYLGRVMLHHDQADPVLDDFFVAAGMSLDDYALAAIDTFRLYEITDPQISIHSNHCAVHTAIDADGTFLRFTVVDVEHPGPALSIHDVLVDSLNGLHTVAVDSHPASTSVCAP